MVRRAAEPSLSLPTITRRRSSSGRSRRILARASSRYRWPFMATSEDAVEMIWFGSRSMSGIGVNRSGSTPTGTMWRRSGDTWWSAHDVVVGVLGHGDDPAQPRRHPGLHLGERVPAGLAHPGPAGLGVLHLEAAVHGDGVVDGAQHRQARALHGQQAVAQALVVLHQVELAAPPAQVVPGPHGEGQGFGERAGGERGDLHPVPAVLELPHPGHPHGEVVVVDVQAGQLDQRDPGVEHGVRLAGQDLDVVAEVHQGLGQMPRVDALAPDVGLAPVGEDRPRAAGPRAPAAVVGRPVWWWGRRWA